MTRDEAVSQIQQILGFRTDKTTEIQNHLMFQQNELEHEPELPYFLRFETTSLTTTADDENLALPTGFIRFWDEDKLQVQNSDGDWFTLNRDEPAYLRSVYQGETGIPKGFSWDGVNGFKLFPTPDDVYTLRCTFYKQGDTLSTNIENIWLKHMPYLLIARAGAAIASSLRDQNALQIFGQLNTAETLKLNALTTKTDDNAKKMVIGGDD